MLRHFYFAAFMQPFWTGVLHSNDETLSGIAGKALKEVGYHVRHTGEWIIRLGDGTEESAARMADAVASLHPYTAELFLKMTPDAPVSNKAFCQTLQAYKQNGTPPLNRSLVQPVWKYRT